MDFILMFKIIFGIVIFFLGSCLASFFGVIMYRVPLKMSIIKPASHCGNCNHVLKWYENIPIFSYLFLGGKCSQCKCKMGIDSLLFEIIGGVSFLLCYLQYGIDLKLVFALLNTSILLLMAGYDYKTHTIEDIFWIIFLVFGIGTYCFNVFYLHECWYEYLISSGIALVFFGLIKLIGYLILKADCLGTGDIIVMVIAGLFLKPIELLLSILVASFVGSVIEIVLMKTGKKEKGELAFLPYLDLGVFIAMLYGFYIVSLLAI